MIGIYLKKIFYILLIVLCSSLVQAQHKVIGKVLNQNQEALVGATVVLLEVIDSTLHQFCLTNQNGEFAISDLKEAGFILQVSYIGHTNYSEKISLAEDKNSTELPPIILSASVEMLQEIEVKAEHVPMGIRGDTISYNTAAFKTKPNATVEDLLKKLPGIEVERDGNIKAQGEDVKQVLVDGKEFFGNDPKMATKNLQAEAVNKVDVFDKKSEYTEFTGIEDGEEQKTINLELKEDHKNGRFGLADVRAGTEGTYQAKLNYFNFSPKAQASVIGASNNINEETFTINDRIEFLGGIGNILSDGLDLANLGFLEDGLNQSTSLGANLNLFFSPELKLNSHYIYNQVNNLLDKKTRSNYLTDDNSYLFIDKTLNDKQASKHNLNTKLTYKPNPLLKIISKNNLTHKKNSQIQETSGEYYNADYSIGNTSSNHTLIANQFGIDSHSSISKKFKKFGRNSVSSLFYKNNQTNKQDSIYNFYDVQNQQQYIHQSQKYNSWLNQFSVGTSFTEYLLKKMFVSLNYKYASDTETPYRKYFNIVNAEERLDEGLSKKYKKTYQYHLTGFSLRRNTKKIKSQISLQRQWTKLKGVINEGENAVEGIYAHWLPAINLDFEFRGSKNLSLKYNTTITPPELEQLLPLPNNIIANYEYIGNPKLTPAYTHNTSLEFILFDNFSLTQLFSNFNVNYSKNRIVYKTEIDRNLFRRVTPINTDRYWDMFTHLNFSRPLKPLKISYTASAQFRYASYNSYLNNTASAVTDNNLDVKLSIKNRKTDFVEVEAGLKWNRNERKYAINPDFNQINRKFDYFLDAECYLPANFVLTNALHFFQYSTDGFNNSPQYFLWNVSVNKTILNNKLEISFSANDLLNQNFGYNRFGTDNSTSEVFYQNLSRFFMLGLAYKIGKGQRDENIKVEINK